MIAVVFAVAFSVKADTDTMESDFFKARILEIQDEKIVSDDMGLDSPQTPVKLRGLDGDYKNKEFFVYETEETKMPGTKYKVGDRVLINRTLSESGEETFYINGYVRTSALWWMALVFALVVVLTGKLKGLRALIVLGITFLIIIKFVVPLILAGHNPLFISIIGSIFILLLAIYITEGFNRESTISIVSIVIALLVTGILSLLFTEMTKLSGFATEEAMFLTGLSGVSINLKGLLLAGIIIGTLGVLDDVVISQVVLVKELKSSGVSIHGKELYKKAMKVGVSHLSSMVNTLFLAYAGCSLPLLVLFSGDNSSALSFTQAINNEVIVTEIVRTLAGSIGLCLAIPIATFLAVKFVKTKTK